MGNRRAPTRRNCVPAYARRQALPDRRNCRLSGGRDRRHIDTRATQKKKRLVGARQRAGLYFVNTTTY